MFSFDRVPVYLFLFYSDEDSNNVKHNMMI